MKSVIHNQYLGPQGQPLPLMTSAEERKPLVTRFGDRCAQSRRLAHEPFCRQSNERAGFAGRRALVERRAIP